MNNLHALLAGAIERASRSQDLFSADDLAVTARRYTLGRWRWAAVAKVCAVGFLTGLPGGLLGGVMVPLDVAYLFAAAGRGCYGIGYILGREVDRHKDLELILACWCGAATAVPAVAAGKVAVKVFGKAALPTAVALGTKIIAKSALKVGGNFLGKLIPQVAAKLAAQLAGKAGAALTPVLGGAVSCGVSYWVADSLMRAAEGYYRNEYVQFHDAGLGLDDLADGLAGLEAAPDPPGRSSAREVDSPLPGALP